MGGRQKGRRFLFFFFGRRQAFFHFFSVFEVLKASLNEPGFIYRLTKNDISIAKCDRNISVSGAEMNDIDQSLSKCRIDQSVSEME